MSLKHSFVNFCTGSKDKLSELRGLLFWLLIGLVLGLIPAVLRWFGVLRWLDRDTYVEQIAMPYVGAVLSVALIISSIMVYLSQAAPRIFHRRGVTPLLCPLLLIVIAAICSVAAFAVFDFLFGSFSYLVVGAFLFIYKLMIVMHEETFGATIFDPLTQKERAQEWPDVNTKSRISEKVFENRITVYQGDAILAICSVLGSARRLAKKLVKTGDYAVYITGDRPWTIIEEKFRDYRGSFHCIDCFTNLYGLDEFREAEDGRFRFSVDVDTTLENQLRNLQGKVPAGVVHAFQNQKHPLSKNARIKKVGKKSWVLSEGDKYYTARMEDSELRIYSEGFYPHTPKPVTIEELHKTLRDVRKNIVSSIGASSDEFRENVRIIYDSISSLASIFGIDELLSFLVHDTNRDKTLGRNTLLLLKEGAIESSVIKRLESLCDISLHVNSFKERVLKIHINKIREEMPPADFLLPV